MPAYGLGKNVHVVQYTTIYTNPYGKENELQDHFDIEKLMVVSVSPQGRERGLQERFVIDD
ncbi:MAG: hypothetical protein ACXABN_19210, partial [Candidatus Thorarchaeota archaeon]